MSVSGFVTDFVSGLGGHFAGLHGSEAIVMQIAFILIIATVIAFLARILKQPLIPGYVIAGVVIGAVASGFISDIELIKAFSEIGIAFLLFTAGLEISFKKIKEANLKKIALIGILQVGLVFGVTLLFKQFLGMDLLQVIYIGVILSFGSTMVVVKLLSDEGELVTMHGRLVLGILLLQDLVAILAIIFFMSGGISWVAAGGALLRLISILLIAVILQKFILNKLFRFAARSTELLLLSSLGVLFLFIVLSSVLQLSIVIGAFIAGVGLANSPYKIELESRMSPLRDFFSILFFVALGLQMMLTGLAINWRLFWVLIVGAFVFKPILTALLLRIFGYRPRTSFFSAISLAQLSEFSLIIGMLGVTLGVLTPSILSTIVLATIITMALTTYFVEYKERLYLIFRKPISFFNFLPIHENVAYIRKKEKKILLVGAHRSGSIILRELLMHHNKDDLVVVDYNPEIINAVVRKGVDAIYGDLGSPELLESIDKSSLKTVVSTVPKLDDNARLLKIIKETDKNMKVILTAGRIDDALDLYELGADYVILPKAVAGEVLAGIVKKSNGELKELRQEHLKKLKIFHRVLY